MTDLIEHTTHVFQFDGFLHWCIQISLVVFAIGIIWMIFRVIRPLRRLAKQAECMMDGKLPTFDPPWDGIREIERLQSALKLMVQQIQAAQVREVHYRNALTESQEQERKRIARELHDDTIQSLIVVSHSIERAMGACGGGDGVAHLGRAREQLIQTIDDLRHLIGDLRPTMLDDLGLVAAVESLAEDYPMVEVVTNGDLPALDHDRELVLYRVAQEGIRNASRHARADHVSTTLSTCGSAVQLEICDDGDGFTVPKHLHELAAQQHYGLLGIYERVTHLGGRMELSSSPQAGTRLCVTFPLAVPQEAAPTPVRTVAPPRRFAWPVLRFPQPTPLLHN